MCQGFAGKAVAHETQERVSIPILATRKFLYSSVEFSDFYTFLAFYQMKLKDSIVKCTLWCVVALLSSQEYPAIRVGWSLRINKTFSQGIKSSATLGIGQNLSGLRCGCCC